MPCCKIDFEKELAALALSHVCLKASVLDCVPIIHRLDQANYVTSKENLVSNVSCCTVSYELICSCRAMKLKFLAACSLLSGWCLATGLISVKVQVENGPARFVGHQFVSNVFFTTQFLGQRLVKVGMPSKQVTTALQSGEPIDPARDKFIKATMLLLSLGFLIMSLFSPHKGLIRKRCKVKSAALRT